MAASAPIPEAIQTLAQSFEFHQAAYKRGQFSEMQVRQEFIDPFSSYRINDLWNLMPADVPVKGEERDLIPSADLLLRIKNAILKYWTLMSELDPDMFFREFRISLIGNISNRESWQEKAFDRPVDRCRFMTGLPGYEEWNGP